MSVSDDWEELARTMKPGAIIRTEPWMDPRLPIVAQMAVRIFTEEKLYRPDKQARSYAVDQAFLLYGEIAIRLAENDR